MKTQTKYASSSHAYRVVFRELRVRTFESWWLGHKLLQESCQSILIQWANPVQISDDMKPNWGSRLVRYANGLDGNSFSQGSVPLVTIKIRDDQKFPQFLLQSWPHYIEMNLKKRLGRKSFIIYGQ
jgi:hypothetical protein